MYRIFVTALFWTLLWVLLGVGYVNSQIDLGIGLPTWNQGARYLHLTDSEIIQGGNFK